MKNQFKFLFAFLFAISLIGSVSALTSITNCTDLQAINDNLAEDYILANDIDCSDTINWNDGVGFISLGDYDLVTPFNGTLDGQGYSIYDLYINSSEDHVGMFEWVQSPAIIKNVHLINAEVWGSESNTGGLVGYLESGSVFNSSVIGNIYGTGRAGGLIGFAPAGSFIESCYFKGNVSADFQVGGLVAVIGGNEILNSYAIANLNSTMEFGGEVGGIVVYSFAGDGLGGNITTSYAVSQFYSLFDEDPQGLMRGESGEGRCNNAYWDKQYSGINISFCGEGKTTTEMKLSATFVNWDFEHIWGINETYTYPCLLWEDDCVRISVIPSPEPEPSGQFSETGQVIYDILDSSGAGLGLFFTFMGLSLPLLLIGLMLVALVIVIAVGIFKSLKLWRER